MTKLVLRYHPCVQLFEESLCRTNSIFVVKTKQLNNRVLNRSCPLTWLMWCTYWRCLRKHSVVKCHFLQIELNNSFLHMLHESIKVSLIAVSRWVEDIQVLWAPWDSCADWASEVMKTEFMWYHWLHQVIRGKEGYQWQGHIRLVWLVEVKLWNVTRIRVRVARSADQLTQLFPVWVSL